MRTAADVLAVARGLADEVLFPDAMRVDRLDVLPAAHLDAFAGRWWRSPYVGGGGTCAGVAVLPGAGL
jgi:hypothetical protein